MMAIESHALQLGDNITLAYEEYGEPTGKMTFGEKIYLYYPTLIIKASRGIITSLEAKEPTQISEQVKEQEIQGVEETADTDVSADQIIEDALNDKKVKGLQVKHEILSSTKYVLASAAERLAIWKRFMESYPEVDVTNEYKRDLVQYRFDQALAKKRTKQKRDSTVIRFETAPVYYDVNPYCRPKNVRYNYRTKYLPKTTIAPTIPFCGTPNKSTTRVQGSYSGNGIGIQYRSGTSSAMGKSAVGYGSSFIW